MLNNSRKIKFLANSSSPTISHSSSYNPKTFTAYISAVQWVIPCEPRALCIIDKFSVLSKPNTQWYISIIWNNSSRILECTALSCHIILKIWRVKLPTVTTDCGSTCLQSMCPGALDRMILSLKCIHTDILTWHKHACTHAHMYANTHKSINISKSHTGQISGLSG